MSQLSKYFLVNLKGLGHEIKSKYLDKNELLIGDYLKV
jgi:hypothetical protein